MPSARSDDARRGQAERRRQAADRAAQDHGLQLGRRAAADHRGALALSRRRTSLSRRSAQWDSPSRIVRFGWTLNESLVVLAQDGSYRLYPLSTTLDFLRLDGGSDTVAPDPTRDMITWGALAAIVATGAVASVPDRLRSAGRSRSRT